MGEDLTGRDGTTTGIGRTHATVTAPAPGWSTGKPRLRTRGGASVSARRAGAASSPGRPRGAPSARSHGQVRGVVGRWR
ncbi:hypothetical protein AQJ58_23960 [Streptomyces sp. DSM 15324]|nr:hypothetical protein AQJ58_23960 [Streptomyces sp. DSM 15324]